MLLIEADSVRMQRSPYHDDLRIQTHEIVGTEHGRPAERSLKIIGKGIVDDLFHHLGSFHSVKMIADHIVITEQEMQPVYSVFDIRLAKFTMPVVLRLTENAGRGDHFQRIQRIHGKGDSSHVVCLRAGLLRASLFF